MENKSIIFTAFLIGLIVLAFSFVMSGTTPSIEEDMVLYFHLNNDSSIGENGTFVVDSSRASNNGTVIGAVFNTSAGILGDGSYLFDGSNDYIDVNHTDSLDIILQLTIAVWIRHTANTGRDFIVTKRSGTGLPFNYGIELNLNNLEFWTFDGDGFFGAISDVSSDLNKWNHWAVTYNEGNVTLYKNGTRVTHSLFEGTNFPKILNTNTQNVSIGGSNVGGNVFDGDIDEVIIWNRSLTASEIFDMYTNYATPTVTAISPRGGEDTDGIVSFSYNVTDDADFQP